TSTYTLSLHDALPIWACCSSSESLLDKFWPACQRSARVFALSTGQFKSKLISLTSRLVFPCSNWPPRASSLLRSSSSTVNNSLRSEEHTSELQSLAYL